MCMRECVYVRACVRVYVRGCVRACVRVCMCMCMYVCACVSTNSDYLTILSVTQIIVSNDRMAVNNVLKRTSQKGAETYFKEVFRHLSRGTEKIYKRQTGWCLSRDSNQPPITSTSAFNLLPVLLLHCASLRNGARWGSLHI